jgi:hypothetical protein
MQRPAQTRSHRFVVVYREEAREIAQAEGIWRGWIEKVPDPRSLENGNATPMRLGFVAVSEVPDLMLRLMQQPPATPIATADQRSSR